MESNRAPGPDNIPAEFYKACWDFVKVDIMRIFEAFHTGTLDVARLDYGVITLIPKMTGAKKIQQFCPICLLRCPYKLITKVLDNRVAIYADKLISRHQNAFIKNRNIMDGVLSLHEVLHHTHNKRKIGVVLKLDFGKAYDKINWDFLLECHRMRGFNDKWCGWIKNILNNGTVSIKLNNETGPYFVSRKGVRQGDPHSPFLFNLAVECLSKMIFNA
uniref:Reverse transcriptase domain-containing protein n=1 Tax=Aegilops tauschii subsp. strangulata TaxID=200361 RepID=A0A453DAZ8_AEGTS